MARTELFDWVERGDLVRLQAALDEDQDSANARDTYGVSLLYLASARGDLALVRLLIERGADVDKTSDAGNAPIMVAAANGHVETIKLLLEHGASTTGKNRWGMSAADWAKWAETPAEVLDTLDAR